MFLRKLRGILALAALLSLTVAAAVNAATIIRRGARALAGTEAQGPAVEETVRAETAVSAEETSPVETTVTAETIVPAGETVSATRGTITDPVTGEEYSDRVIIVSVDQDMTDGMMQELLKKYGLSVVYDYRSFSMYALSAGRALSAEEMAELIRRVSGEAHVLNVSRDGVVHLHSAGAADI